MPELCLYYKLEKHYYQNSTTGNCWFKQSWSRLESFINLCLGSCSTVLAYRFTITNVILWSTPYTFSIILSRHTFFSFFFCHQKVLSSYKITSQALEIPQNNNYNESHIVLRLLSILLSFNALIFQCMLESRVIAV